MSIFIRRTCFFTLIVFAGILASLAMSFIVGPSVFDLFESYFGTLPYEGALRFYFLGAALLFLFGWGAVLFYRLSREHAIIFILTALTIVAMAQVFGADTTHRLQEEFSWIRYTTAGALLMTALLAAMLGAWYRKHETAARRFSWFWWAVAIVFLYVAGDELFEVHEMIGGWIERTFGMSHVVTDYVTVAYAVIGLLSLAVFFRALYREYIPTHARAVQLLFLGGIFYLLSTLFDTIDVWVHESLVALGVYLTRDGSFIFSDLWYPLYAPKQFLNSLEEIFENTAAALFAISLLLLVIKKYWPEWIAAPTRSFRRTSFALTAVTIVGSVGIVVFTWPGITVASPFRDIPARAVATAKSHKLFHADVLVAVEPWGVLIGNEGEGNVVALDSRALHEQLQRGWMKRNVDGLAATTRAIYVADPASGRIVRYTEYEGWKDFLTRKDGLKTPEGVVVVGNLLYVVDEEEQKIFEVNTKTRAMRSMELMHPRFQAPEGIAYHPGLDRLLVTDDVTGLIFALRFGEAPTIFAGRSAGLAHPEEITILSNGNVLVTDNGTREIVEFNADGLVVKRIRVRRMYGDLHGIAVREEEVEVEGEAGVEKEKVTEVLVLTADGFGSASFMPSTVWRLE